MNVQVIDMSARVNQVPILTKINLDIRQGEFVGVIGPNGSGKSTLLKHIYRVLLPEDGMILLENKDILHIHPKELARKMAVVSQESPVIFDFSVQEIVLMGRSPHKRLLELDSTIDYQMVEQALEQVGLKEYSQRSFASLSGGEKQRVLIARALAQQATFLVLDEPTNHLDIQHQLQILELVRRLKITVVAALHDLNLAAMYCDRLIVLQNGEIVANGTPEEVLTRTMLREVFGVATEVTIHPLTGKTHITFLSGEHE